MAPLTCFQPYQFTETYLHALKTRDAEVEAHFVRYFTPLLEIKLRKRKCSPEQAEDVIQETFLRVLKLVRSKISVRHPERFGSLVNSVCVNVLRESYRARARYDALEDLQIDPSDRAARPDELVAARELREKVSQLLMELPKRDCDILRSVFLEEQDKDEVCRRLRVTRDYLRVLLCRAKGQFQKVCEKERARL